MKFTTDAIRAATKNKQTKSEGIKINTRVSCPGVTLKETTKSYVDMIVAFKKI